MSSELERKFWGKVCIQTIEGLCWPYTGGISKSGYGVFWDGEKCAGAHRFAYLSAHDLDEYPDKLVCHACDNKVCCNPGHLFLGTHKDNTQDMIRKGRKPVPVVRNRLRGEEWHKRVKPSLPRGESHPHCKLTSAQIEYIRTCAKRNIDLARELSVRPETISRIRNGHIRVETSL